MRIEREREILKTGKSSIEVTWSLTSLGTDRAGPEELLALVRNHWHIENRLHYVRDFTYDEDRCRAYVRHLPRNLACLTNVAIAIVRCKGSGIKSVPDLRGKRISLDEPGSGTLVDARIILEAYGLSEDDLKPEYVKPDVAVEKIRNNLLDAFFIVAGYPTKSVLDLTSSIGAELIPISGPIAESVIKKYEFFSPEVIPAGVYAGVGETKTLSVLALWVVDENLDSELVYQVTKAVWNPRARVLFEKGHPKALEITVDTALDGVGIPLHPGTERYYRENGLLK